MPSFTFKRIPQRLFTRFARLCPRWSRRRYIRRARQWGIDRLYLVLSFDCDTQEDIAAAEQLDQWLRERNIKACYAVPGAQLKQGAETYRRIAENGSPFLNHGAAPHTEKVGDAYQSVTFYHQWTHDEVVQDITRGHEIVTETIGQEPRGFRAPHFGLFQKPHQLELQYQTLRSLGYRYSTSTLPNLAFRRGPVYDAGGLFEFPLSGSYASCLQILDSWGSIKSPQEPVLQEVYSRLFVETVQRFVELKIPGLLNYYVDPAHVIRSDAFYEAMNYLIQQKIPSLHYEDVLQIRESNLS